MKEKVHKQQEQPVPWEDCQAEAVKKCVGALQGGDWGTSQGIKSHHAQTYPGHGPLLLHSSGQPEPGQKRLERIHVRCVQDSGGRVEKNAQVWDDLGSRVICWC